MTSSRTRREFLRDLGIGAAALPFVMNLPGLGFANTLGSLAVVSVLGSIYPLATAALARIRLGELLTTRQKLGAGLAMLGVILISAS